MPFSVTRVDDKPIVMYVIDPNHNIATDGERDIQALFDLLEGQANPVFLIMDIRNYKLTLDDMIVGANHAARQFKIFKHPKVIESILISENQMAALASRGLNTPVFGNVKIKVVKTMDDAYAYIRG